MAARRRRSSCSARTSASALTNVTAGPARPVRPGPGAGHAAVRAGASPTSPPAPRWPGCGRWSSSRSRRCCCLVFEQIANQAHKFSLMTGGQAPVPVTYLLPRLGLARPGWAGQHSDHPYSAVRPRRREDRGAGHPGRRVRAAGHGDPRRRPGGGLRARRRARRARGRRLRRRWRRCRSGVGRIAPRRAPTSPWSRSATSCTTRWRWPRSWPARSRSRSSTRARVYPFDWDGLAASVERTGRLVVIDDANRTCGLAGEILATAAEEMRLVAPPRRVTRPDGAVLPFAPGLDRAVQPSGTSCARRSRPWRRSVASADREDGRARVVGDRDVKVRAQHLGHVFDVRDKGHRQHRPGDRCRSGGDELEPVRLAESSHDEDR